MLDREIAHLQRTELLAAMEREALRLLAFGIERRTLRAREKLFEAGDAATGAYLIVTGEVLVRAPDGREASFGPGALLGETALFTETVRVAGALTLTDATVLFLSRALMRRVLAEFPNSALRVRAVMARRLLGTLDGLSKVAPLFGEPTRAAPAPDEAPGGR